MATQIIDKNTIIKEIKKLPENKLSSLFDYVEFLKWDSDDTLTSHEEDLIKKAEKEIQSGKGVNWRKIKRNV